MKSSAFMIPSKMHNYSRSSLQANPSPHMDFSGVLRPIRIKSYDTDFKYMHIDTHLRLIENHLVLGEMHMYMY